VSAAATHPRQEQVSPIGLTLSILFIGAYAFLFWTVVIRRRLGTQLVCLYEREPKPASGMSLVYWLSPLCLLAIWSAATYAGLVSTKLLPTPEQVWQSFSRLMVTGVLPAESLVSFARVFTGFFAATAIGVPLGLLAGAFVAARQLIMPVNSLLRYIPPTAFVALLIVYFGVGEPFKYAVVFLGIIFFFIQMTIDVVDDLEVSYVEMALTSGYSTWDIFTRIIIPFSMPRIMDVMRINLSAAWTFLVVAELIGSEQGLGHFIAISQRFLRLGDLYAGIFLFGLIGLATDICLEFVSRKVFRWYYVALKR
jgi:NitT/TauT family transport system permease protein